MNTKEIYTLLASRNPDQVVRHIEGLKEPLDCFHLSCLAIAYCLEKKLAKAKEVSSRVDWNECRDAFSRARYYEAQILIGVEEKMSYAQLEPLAQKALEYDEHSVWAKSIMGQIEFTLGDIEGGERQFLDILERFPQASWAYLHLTRHLIAAKKYQRALKYVLYLDDPFLKGVYWFLARVFYPWYWMIFIGLILLLINPATAIVSFLSLLMLSTVVLAYAVFRREVIIIRAVMTLVLVLFVGFMFGSSTR